VECFEKNILIFCSIGGALRSIHKKPVSQNADIVNVSDVFVNFNKVPGNVDQNKTENEK